MAEQTVTLHIPAIDCDGCINTVRKTVEAAGATLASGDAGTKTVEIAFDSERLTRAGVVAALEAIGFAPDDEP